MGLGRNNEWWAQSTLRSNIMKKINEYCKEQNIHKSELYHRITTIRSSSYNIAVFEQGHFCPHLVHIMQMCDLIDFELDKLDKLNLLQANYPRLSSYWSRRIEDIFILVEAAYVKGFRTLNAFIAACPDLPGSTCFLAAQEPTEDTIIMFDDFVIKYLNETSGPIPSKSKTITAPVPAPVPVPTVIPQNSNVIKFALRKLLQDIDERICANAFESDEMTKIFNKLECHV